MDQMDDQTELALKSLEAKIYCAQMEKLKLRIHELENENQELQKLVKDLISQTIINKVADK